MREFSARHPAAEGPLRRWYQVVAKTAFESFDALKATFDSVDKVGPFTVFNTGGNKYRLVVAIHYNRRKVYIRRIMTHREYSKSEWNA